MNIRTNLFRATFLSFFVFNSLSCFAADCDANRKYFQCFNNYIENLKQPTSAISSADFRKNISEATHEAENLLRETAHQYAENILSKLNSLNNVSEPFPRSFSLEEWKLQQNQEIGGIPFKILATNECFAETPTTKKDCGPIYQQAILYAELIHKVGSLIDRYNKDAKQHIYAEYSSRKDRWHSYLYDTQFQYAWELIANRYIDINYREIKQDSFKNEIGFREPPQRKGILIHPDIGLQYIQSQPQGQRIKPALILQWIGYQQWNWTENKASDLRGISLVSTLSDNATVTRVGWGLQFQYDDYAFALTRHNSGVSITLNLKLVDRMSTLNNDYAQKLQDQKP